MTLATYSDAFREFGRNAGMERPDRAWLLTDWDVWVRNPHYHGPEVPHPETEDDEGLIGGEVAVGGVLPDFDEVPF